MGVFLPIRREGAWRDYLRWHTTALLSENSPLVNVFDVGGKYASLHVRASCSEQDIVWVPVDGKNGRTDWFLELLRDPPIVVWVKGANGDRSLTKGCWAKLYTKNKGYPPCTTGDGEFILERAPTDEGRSAIDTQQDEGWLPDVAPGKGIGCLLPHVGVSIL
jgi:hypothetical protein